MIPHTNLNYFRRKQQDYYMGKNTPDRQEFIINNLRVEVDTPEDIVA